MRNWTPVKFKLDYYFKVIYYCREVMLRWLWIDATVWNKMSFIITWAQYYGTQELICRYFFCVIFQLKQERNCLWKLRPGDGDVMSVIETPSGVIMDIVNYSCLRKCHFIKMVLSHQSAWTIINHPNSDFWFFVTLYWWYKKLTCKYTRNIHRILGYCSGVKISFESLK